MNNLYTEIYDTKSHRIRCRDKGPYHLCPKCKGWQGHELECEDVTVDGIALLLANSRAAEEAAWERAARYHTTLQIMAGKVAILRHENNKLRKANDKLRKELR